MEEKEKKKDHSPKVTVKNLPPESSAPRSTRTRLLPVSSFLPFFLSFFLLSPSVITLTVFFHFLSDNLRSSSFLK